MTTNPPDQPTATPECNCNAGPAGWTYQKGSGPDPAHCPVHGDQPTAAAAQEP